MSGRPVRVRLLALGVLWGCPITPPEPRAQPVPASTDAPAAVHDEDPALARAHLAALERLRDAILPALVAHDPVAAAAIGQGELAPPPVSRARRGALRELLAAPRRERVGIDPLELAPESAMLLRTVSHGLERIDDDLAGRTPLRVEPGAYLSSLEPLLDRLEHDLARGDTEAAPAVLSALAIELSQATAQLGAASTAATEAAIEDARGTAARLRRLADLVPSPVSALVDAAERAARAAEAVAEELSTIAEALPAARTVDRSAAIAPASAPSKVLRLDDRWGVDALRSALAREAVEVEPSVLSAQLTATVARLVAMEARTRSTSASGPAAPVTPERCTATWSALSGWVKAQPALAGARLDCAATVRRLGTRPLDDDELAIELVYEGVVVPTRDARRREVDPALALVGGAIAPHGHRWALTISVLDGAAMHGAARRALRDARDAACLAGAALLVHGDATVGPDDLVARIGAGCDRRTGDEWWSRAVARPHEALRGAGLVLVGDGPADALAMQRFWWAPLGLVRPLASPPAPPPESPPPGVKIEPIEPAR